MTDGLNGASPAGWARTTLGAIQLDGSEGINPSKTPDAPFELYSVPSHQGGVPETVRGRAIGSNKKTVIPTPFFSARSTHESIECG